MTTKTIRQTETFDASPKEVYGALSDEKKHASFNGASVTIDKNIDGKFSVYDGYCHGYNIELVESEKIVQAWHFSEDGWPDDHFSICTFLCRGDGDQTILTFTQTGVPEHKVKALTSGWKEFYWEPLRNYLKTNC